MILNAAHLKKSFVGETVIDDASFFLNEHDKAAIVGPNGAGKSTLLNLLTGELPRDEGEVTLKKGCTLGYLHQDNTLDSELTIEEELTKVIQPILDLEAELSLMQREMKHAEGAALEKLLAAYTEAEHRYELMDGYAARSRVTGIIRGLGFSEADATRPLSSLSGGQKTRVFLGKLLLEQPDLILLDEPTNHLDLESIEWLETYLMNYAGAVLIVSHDRFFLDRIVNKIFDLNHGKVTSYDGNYTQFTEKKEALAEAAARAYENQQAEIKHQEAVIQKLRAFNREKSIKRAESREKLLDKVERLDNPYEAKKDMALYFTPDEVSGNDVLSVEHLGKAFGDNVLFSDLNFSLKRGEHVAIMGGNGTGKTTLLKIINGLLPPDSGTVTLGTKVFCSYYDQEHQVLHPEKTLFEELQDTWPDMTNTEVRNMLAAFLFTGDDVFKRIKDLSGGERGRVSLAKLMLSHANFLLLDEPTNHLDMESKEILEHAIRAFPGTVLYVSHDRYFINRTATRILNLTEHCLVNYIGNYDYYLEKKADAERAALPANTVAAEQVESDATTTSAEDYKTQKAQKAAEKKRRAELEACEQRIAELEETLRGIEEEFLLPENQRDAAALLAIQKRKDSAEEELADCYERWETLAD